MIYIYIYICILDIFYTCYIYIYIYICYIYLFIYLNMYLCIYHPYASSIVQRFWTIFEGYRCRFPDGASGYIWVMAVALLQKGVRGAESKEIPI